MSHTASIASTARAPKKDRISSLTLGLTHSREREREREDATASRRNIPLSPLVDACFFPDT
ncbi:MAG TPA: hypothetical protein VIH11_03830, partial [Gemmatimonadaceae bacterium]